MLIPQHRVHCKCGRGISTSPGAHCRLSPQPLTSRKEKAGDTLQKSSSEGAGPSSRAASSVPGSAYGGSAAPSAGPAGDCQHQKAAHTSAHLICWCSYSFSPLHLGIPGKCPEVLGAILTGKSAAMSECKWLRGHAESPFCPYCPQNLPNLRPSTPSTAWLQKS